MKVQILTFILIEGLFLQIRLFVFFTVLYNQNFSRHTLILTDKKLYKSQQTFFLRNFFLSQLWLSPQLENKTKETVFEDKLLALGFCSICPNFMTFYLSSTPTIIFYEVENFAIVIFVTPPLSQYCIWKLIISILTTSCTKAQMRRKICSSINQLKQWQEICFVKHAFQYKNITEQQIKINIQIYIQD